MKVIYSEPAGKRTKVGIALPDNEEQRRVIDKIYPALIKLHIKLFWATKSQVTIE